MQLRVETKAAAIQFVPEGWAKLVDTLWDAVHELDPDIEVLQVKEKFGGLRFYVYTASVEASRLIKEAEKQSYTICEVCGEPGTNAQAPRYLRTLCPKHRRNSVDKLGSSC